MVGDRAPGVKVSAYSRGGGSMIVVVDQIDRVEAKARWGADRGWPNRLEARREERGYCWCWRRRCSTVEAWRWIDANAPFLASCA